jgi:cation/acetate symporter
MNISAIFMFVVIISITLVITYLASKRISNKNDFYTAGGKLTGLQNGLAISGDYMSAGTFLGITGLVYFAGYDGLIICVSAVIGLPFILFLIAERLRNLGEYTFVDVVSYRLSSTSVRVFSASSSLLVVLIYLIGQIVASGTLIQVLFDVPYLLSIILIGSLMSIYVIFGGMLATTWVQIVKATLLLASGTFLAGAILLEVGLNFETLLQRATESHAKGRAILAPGLFFKDPISVLSLCLAGFGIAGLPHVLMRFFTVANVREARKSIFYATGFIGYFEILVFIIGLGAIFILAGQTDYFTADGHLLGGANMPAIHLSHAIGGDFFLGFISAVAFATILAVVTGLTLSAASTVSHDIYSQLIKKGESNEKMELLLSKITVISTGIIAIGLGYIFQHENIAFLNAFALSLAAATNFPILVMSIFWSGMTSRGAVIGGFIALILTMVLVLLSPTVWINVFGYAEAPFPYTYPTLFTMPVAFLAIFWFSITDKSERAASERAAFTHQFVRSETGFGANTLIN